MMPSAAEKFNCGAVVLIVLPDTLTLPTSNCPVTSAFTVRAVPFTSNGYCGVAVFMPILLLLTSMYNRLVSKAKSAPLRRRLDFKS